MGCDIFFIYYDPYHIMPPMIPTKVSHNSNNNILIGIYISTAIVSCYAIDRNITNIKFIANKYVSLLLYQSLHSLVYTFCNNITCKHSRV